MKLDCLDARPAIELIVPSKLKLRLRCDCNCDSNIAKLINIFKYLSHCLPASAPATATASGLHSTRDPSRVCGLFIEKPFYGFMLGSHCANVASLPHQPRQRSAARPRPSLVRCGASASRHRALCGAAASSSRSASVRERPETESSPLALFLSHFKWLFVVVPPGSGINSQCIMAVNKLFLLAAASSRQSMLISSAKEDSSPPPSPPPSALRCSMK